MVAELLLLLGSPPNWRYPSRAKDMVWRGVCVSRVYTVFLTVLHHFYT